MATNTVEAALLRLDAKLDQILAKPDDRPLLTVMEAYTRLGIGKRKFYDLMDAGEIAWVQVGSHRKFEPRELDRWIEAHRQTEASDGR
jgi:excisionase family DNA binding protein